MKFGNKTEKARQYTENMIENVECKDTPCCEMYQEKEMEMLLECASEDKVMAILYALFIGFANGVKWERK